MLLFIRNTRTEIECQYLQKRCKPDHWWERVGMDADFFAFSAFVLTIINFYCIICVAHTCSSIFLHDFTKLILSKMPVTWVPTTHFRSIKRTKYGDCCIECRGKRRPMLSWSHRCAIKNFFFFSSSSFPCFIFLTMSI